MPELRFALVLNDGTLPGDLPLETVVGDVELDCMFVEAEVVSAVKPVVVDEEPDLGRPMGMKRSNDPFLT